MSRFRVKAGLHVTGSTRDGTRKVFKRGDVFDTDSDKETHLCDKDREKYERVSDPVTFRRTVSSSPSKSGVSSPSPQEVEEVEVDLSKLDSMTTSELQQFAKEYGINTKDAKDRNELLKNIKDELNKM
jgi:hypothetical protein